MKKPSVKTIINTFYLLCFIVISSQNLYGFVNTNSKETSNHNNLKEENKIQHKISNKLQRKFKKLEKKIEKYKQTNQERIKGIGVLIPGLLFLILGIWLIALSAGAGILNGLLLLIVGVPVLIAGIVLLIVFLSKQ